MSPGMQINSLRWLRCTLVCSLVSALLAAPVWSQTPWPPPQVPPSVDINTAGIESLLNGGPTGPSGVNLTPFTNIVFDLELPGSGDCAVRVQPNVPGLLLYDLDAIRLCNPRDPLGLPGPPLWFDPNNECGFLADLLLGLQIYDPRSIRLCLPNPPPNGPFAPPLWFGPEDLCGLEAIPNSGLRLYDPSSIRICPPPILPPDSPIPPIWFGPENLCGLQARPEAAPGNRGLRLYDVDAVRICPPPGTTFPIPPFWFGEGENCGFSADPQLGLQLYDPTAIRICPPNPGVPIPPLWFGEGNQCGIQVDRFNPDGLRLYDPLAIRLCNPIDPVFPPPFLRFGPTDDCGFGVTDRASGIVEIDPVGLRLAGDADLVNGTPPTQGLRLLFGLTDDCSVQVDPTGQLGNGLIILDPNGARILNPEGGETRLTFGGPEDVCRIRAGAGPLPNQQLGMIFDDPGGFLFNSPAGIWASQYNSFRGFKQRSSQRWKHNIQTIPDAMNKISALRGVTFDWNEDQGGGSSVGFIAEEVAEVMPQVVSFEADGKTADGVEYANITALLVEGVKEQQQQISANQKAFEQLKAENAELKRQLADTKQQGERTLRLEEEVQQLRDQLDAIVENLAASQ